MTLNNVLDIYDDVKDDLKFLSMSVVRTKIMMCLNEGPCKLKDLKEELELDSSAIKHVLNDLEDQNFAFKNGDAYSLSEKGIIICTKLAELIKTLSVVKKNEKFWLKHDITSIPHEFVLRLGDLERSCLVESELTDILKTFENFKQLLHKSKVIKGVSPIFKPEFIEEFKTIIENDVYVELILTNKIMNKTMRSMDPGTLIKLGKLFLQNKLKIWKIKEEEVNVAFTVTDTALSLGLFSTNGEYDLSRDLVSDDPEAVKWGNDLFEYYKGKAELFKIGF
ncbi:helix-turn-helix transcriptional regulator [Methanobacterium aggregans]|uniref:helix-turn-helix transcriptional regulator n=2 Tax=Methanobacterium aggregans TaxID=1615586 RepID=UPI001AE9EB3A|nr:transcriptional regulator FilR1 domain-containing protein [Methanobacterium aggregans]MBP2046636.1 putative transcriptional regulator [Methanobacterium aggregans]